MIAVAAARRISVAAVVVACSVTLTPLVARASVGPLADPAANTTPSGAFVRACAGMATTKAANDTCDQAALIDFDSVRASEGLGPMTLPGEFDILTVPEQLLTISNIERVERGLTPVLGLTAGENALALAGAIANGDPAFPAPFGDFGREGSSNWAGAGKSALLDDFYWMYDDGLGSFNGDCTAADLSGCWGHRHDILSPSITPLVRGAASVPSPTYGASMAEEFIGGYQKLAADPVLAPSWAAISAAVPITVSVTGVKIIADTHTPARTTVTVKAPGSGAVVGMAITSGASAWSVSPATCDLPAAGSCVVQVTFAPPHSGTRVGALTVTGPSGVKIVGLNGRQAPPRLSLSAAKHDVARHQTVVFHGQVQTYGKRTALAHETVTLQRHRHGGVWHDLGSQVTGASGRVHFTTRVGSGASYRLLARAADGAAEGHSAPLAIKVH